MNLHGKKTPDINFNPEITIYHIEGNENKPNSISFLISSGDKQNNNRNIKIIDENILSMAASVKISDEYILSNNDQTAHLEAETFLDIEYQDGTKKSLILCKHNIQVPSIKKSNPVSFPDYEEIKQQINDIIQDEYSYAMEDYNDFMSGETSLSAQTNKPKSKIKLDIFINVICIIIVISSIAVISKRFLFNESNNKMTLNSEIQSYLENENTKATNAQIESHGSSDDIESDVLAEFGLEKGVKLE